MSTRLQNRRVLVKVSGEAFRGDDSAALLNIQAIESIASDIHDLTRHGIQVAFVIGAGNLFRGADLVAKGVERVISDNIGMLGTVVNALAFQDVLQRRGIPVRTMSAIHINQLCEPFVRSRAIRHLEKQRVVIFAAGTGNPFFTTDSAASLRAIEIGAELLIKATKVNGVYAMDPHHHPEAKRFKRLGYDQMLQMRLNVMDMTAVVLCQENNLPLRVVDMHRQGALLRAVRGEDEGTLIDNAPHLAIKTDRQPKKPQLQ